MPCRASSSWRWGRSGWTISAIFCCSSCCIPPSFMDNKEQPHAPAPSVPPVTASSGISRPVAESAPKRDPQEAVDEALAELTAKPLLCERERDEYLNGWGRAPADFANYKNEEFKRLEEG